MDRVEHVDRPVASLPLDRPRDDAARRQRQGSTGDGLGFYMVSLLAEVYGGGVALEEATEGASSRVTIPTWGSGEAPAW